MNTLKRLLPLTLCLLTVGAAHADLIKQSATYNRTVLITSTTDHISGATGLTAFTITLSKAGGAVATITPTVTEIGAGRYSVALVTGNTATLGALDMTITATGADPTDSHDQVVAFDPNSDLGAATLATVNTTTVSTNTIAAALPSAAANATAVWGSTTRALTDKANFALVSTEYANIAAVTSTYGFDGPPAGTILTLTITRNGSSQPVLTWTADPAATLYKVYRSTDGANYTVIATPAVGTLTYTDTARPAGATVYYHITSTH